MSEIKSPFRAVRQKLRDAVSAYGDDFTHEELRVLYEVVTAAEAVYGARKEVFQIAAPETMWRKMETLGRALDRG